MSVNEDKTFQNDHSVDRKKKRRFLSPEKKFQIFLESQIGKNSRGRLWSPIMIEQAKEKGLPVTRTCAFWRVNRRRVVRWCRKKKNGQSLRNLKPGPREPVHKLLRQHNGRSIPPVRKELTGPNQRWCWEISYLPTYEKGVFLYLFLLLDEYSRKAISWSVSWHQTAEEARCLLGEGLINENILLCNALCNAGTMSPRLTGSNRCPPKSRSW